MKLKNDVERRIFAGAFVRIFHDAQSRGVAPCHREQAANEGRDVIEYWTKTIAAQAIDEANDTVRVYRDGLREWDHD